MRLVIVDDDKIVSKSLEMILQSDSQIEVVGVGCCYEEALELYFDKKPDMILLDIRMGEKTGIMVAREILSLDPLAKVLFLTTFTDNEYIFESLKMGAKGYILKQDFESLIPSIKAISAGQNVFGKEIMDKIPKAWSQEDNLKEYHLHEKELKLVELIAQGYSNKEIAGLIFLSEGTVRNYISELLEKLELRDRTQLAVFYYNAKVLRDRKS